MSALSPAAFRQRFAVARFPDGGVVVDTITGAYFRLNPSAATVCEVLQSAADAEDASRQVARRLNLARDVASEQVREMIAAALTASSARSPSAEPTPYQPSPDGGYDLCFEGRPIFHVDADGRTVTLVGQLRSSTFTIRDFLRNLGPRIAFLRGLVVLHGSAVVDAGKAVAMCGVSEAGKTTTARLLSRYGRQLLAEDIVVAAARDSNICVFRDGERHINAWATETARAFESAEVRVAQTEALMAVQNGSTVDLDAVWFMDAGRRTEADSITNRSLLPAEALVRVLSNSFVGGADWRRFLEVSRLVVAATRAFETSVPDTLPRLEDAIANQRIRIKE